MKAVNETKMEKQEDEYAIEEVAAAAASRWRERPIKPKQLMTGEKAASAKPPEFTNPRRWLQQLESTAVPLSERMDVAESAPENC